MNNIGKISGFIILFSSSFSHAMEEYVPDAHVSDPAKVATALIEAAKPAQEIASKVLKDVVGSIRAQASQATTQVTPVEVPASPVVSTPTVQGVEKSDFFKALAQEVKQRDTFGSDFMEARTSVAQEANVEKVPAKSWISIRKPTAKELQRYGLSVAVVVVIGTVTFILYKYGAFKAVYKKAQQRPVVTASTVVATVALMGTIFALYKNNVKPADMAKYLPNVNALTKKFFGSKAAALHVA